MSVIALDVGGTFIKYGFIKDGNIKEKGEISTPKDSAEKFYQTVAKLIKTHEKALTGVAISLPGFINPKTQVAVRTGALGYLTGNNIGKELRRYLSINVPISVENDANCAAIAEKLAGNAQDVHDFITVTLGTGVGGAIYINNQLLHGKSFSAGEFGMMVTDYSQHGFATLHEFASTRALCDEYARQKGYPIGTVEGYQVMSEIDDPIVKKIVDQWSMRVAICLFNLIVTLNPQKILIGGGISAQPVVVSEIRHQFKLLQESDRRLQDDIAMPDIQAAKFGNEANLLGALYGLLLQLEEN